VVLGCVEIATLAVRGVVVVVRGVLASRGSDVLLLKSLEACPPDNTESKHISGEAKQQTDTLTLLQDWFKNRITWSFDTATYIY
jgi:hypothetical protein